MTGREDRRAGTADAAEREWAAARGIEDDRDPLRNGDGPHRSLRHPLADRPSGTRPAGTLTDDSIVLPADDGGPLSKIAVRLGVALGLVVLVAMVTWFGRDGYVDPEGDGTVSLLDAFYYSTVSITTTGYGDIRPVTDTARLVTTLIVTPARILFLIILVGTTLEILAERGRQAYRLSRWRKNLQDHTIVCGYGTKGRSAVKTLIDKGVEKSKIVVIDPDPGARARAGADDLTIVEGNSETQEALRAAGIERAKGVTIAVDRDDTAVLTTLTARELNPKAKIVASVREDENVHLLHQSGADAVVTSSGATGRMLGMSMKTPEIVKVVEDMLTVGGGLDITDREVTESSETAAPLPTQRAIALAVVRDGEVIDFHDDRCRKLQPGDRVIELYGHRKRREKPDGS
ncbi:potassium channel family protein [Thermoleophilia bacterium SCSIO 60948]|nr:potassium channel family protein [Thermoleophilia bacterium SCSIO 60948]